MDSKQVLARFEAERQALALMDHPNIARVLDAGEIPPAYAGGSPRPYFVMELVKGVSITEFCDKNQLAPEARLALFLDICHAIQHAHHKGVIHRDIKPTNVLVTLHDGVPVVKVIDFGVAKALLQKLTERTLFTGYGQLLGTPLYMSPEQAEMSGLHIDTRSDIYSLGVLLYELLSMAISTLLTTWFHRRALRHFWLFVGVVGCAACLWWMSSVDNFTSKGQVALMIGCWGLFVGLFPPAFLQDEVEGLDRRDFLYGGAVAVVFLIVPIVVVPTLTSTIVSAWTDRAADAQRLNLRQNRPEVDEASARVADYYHQRGVGGPELSQLTSTVLGSSVKTEAVAHGIQSGLRFLSLIVGGFGLLVTTLLARSGVARPA